MSSALSFVCKPPQHPSSLLEETQSSSQVGSSSHISYGCADIEVSSTLCSNFHLPGFPSAVYVRLRFQDDRTGVPSALHSKALLWCDNPPDAPHITMGTRLETSSVYPASIGMFKEAVHCVSVKHGRAIVEVATFCDSDDEKLRVWEMASFLVSFPAEMVDMPVVRLPLRQVLWDLFTSCLWYSWCR